ncbi:hypothetical protein HPB50_005566 [Hyalomma asiaticum]|uniref:Uncharacterized protein n=1 Tax=Hyalomma asiaticum TaxID=266040 RepID=A0ACB7SN72_HYAAI|nr:hypothetical protein HPB50_005566 [Hyalomma asiaticum]
MRLRDNTTRACNASTAKLNTRCYTSQDCESCTELREIKMRSCTAQILRCNQVGRRMSVERARSTVLFPGTRHEAPTQVGRGCIQRSYERDGLSGKASEVSTSSDGGRVMNSAGLVSSDSNLS